MYLALAKGVISGVNTGIDTSQQNDWNQQQGDYLNQSHQLAAQYAQQSADDQMHNLGLQGDWLKQMPQLNQLKLAGLGASFNEFLSQRKNLPMLAAFANLVNTNDNNAMHARLESVAPGIMDAQKNNAATLDAYSLGQIPDDVKQQLARETAQRGLDGGWGGGSGTTYAENSDYARNFGLTSLNLKDKAVADMPGVLQTSMAMNPSNVASGSLLYSPSAIQTRQDNQAFTNTGITNQNLDRGWQAKYGDVLKNFTVTPAFVNTTPVPVQQKNPFLEGVQSFFGGLAGGGGMGGGNSSSGGGSSSGLGSIFSYFGYGQPGGGTGGPAPGALSPTD